MTEPLKPVTGVAKGSEGTGTALDDTQEYDVTTFMAPAAVVDDDPVVDDPVAEEAAPASAPHAVEAAAPMPVAPIRQRRVDRRRPAGIPLAIKAGLLTAAIALAVVFGASLASHSAGDETIGGLPLASPSATTAPTEGDEGDGGDEGGGEEGGKGNGNGCGNGKGNGNNC